MCVAKQRNSQNNPFGQWVGGAETTLNFRGHPSPGQRVNPWTAILVKILIPLREKEGLTANVFVLVGEGGGKIKIKHCPP